MRKGVSSIIGAIIAIAIVLSILTSLILFGFGAFSAQQQSIDYARSIELARQMENLVITYNTTNGSTFITITNNGSVRVDIKSLLYRDSNNIDHILDLWLVGLNATQVTNAGIYLKALNNGGIYNATPTNGYVYLSPGGAITLMIEGKITPISVVTATGNVIRAPQIINTGSGNYTAVAGSVLIYPIALGTVTDLLNRTDITVDEDELLPPTVGNYGTGMKSYNKAYVVAYEFENVSVYTSGLRFGNLIVGYNPKWTIKRVGPTKFNILITGPYLPGSSDGGTLDVGGTPLPLDELYPSGWRVKIIGFEPSTPDGIHVYYENTSYGIYLDRYGNDTLGRYYYASIFNNKDFQIVDAYIELNGVAEKVIVYRMTYTTSDYSYEPFLFSADVDGNGMPEIIFMTEDRRFGDQNSFNDVYYLGKSVIYTTPDVCRVTISKGSGGSSKEYYYRIYDDWSVKPFFINLTGYPIKGSDTAMVIVAMRLYFHDNVGGDVDEIDHADRPLIGVYLIDLDTGQIASSREYDYQELMNLEDTFPANQNYIMETVPLIVPDTDHTYIVAFGFQDPYSDYCDDNTLTLYHDDGDFTVAIEWLGMTFYARP